MKKCAQRRHFREVPVALFGAVVHVVCALALAMDMRVRGVFDEDLDQLCSSDAKGFQG